MSLIPAKPALVILTAASTLAAWQWVRPQGNSRFPPWKTVKAVIDLPVPQPEDPHAARELALIQRLGLSRQTIEDEAKCLAPFYEALWRLEIAAGAPKATPAAEAGAKAPTVRILHYGDSPVTADLISADIRRLLQKRFGDAGHGFCLLAKPWAWYGHDGVTLSASGWKIFNSMDYSSRFRYYGAGGVAFVGSPGSWASFQLRRPGHSMVEVAYLRQPQQASVEVRADGATLGSFSTFSEKLTSGFAAFALPGGARQVEVVVTSGSPRLFGVSFHKAGPGLIYDSLGLNGASTAVPGRLFEESHWAEQLRHYRPDLIILNYGLNESGFPAYVDKHYAADLQHLIRRIKRCLPGVSILLMCPTDRGRQLAGDMIGTEPALPRLVDIQRRVARQEAVALFNTFRAMGGEGTMGRWYTQRPRLVSADYLHPLPAGARIIGELAERALMQGFLRYKLDKMRQKTPAGMSTAAQNPLGRNAY